jgi:hypothetical protein
MGPIRDAGGVLLDYIPAGEDLRFILKAGETGHAQENQHLITEA